VEKDILDLEEKKEEKEEKKLRSRQGPHLLLTFTTAITKNRDKLYSQQQHQKCTVYH